MTMTLGTSIWRTSSSIARWRLARQSQLRARWPSTRPLHQTAAAAAVALSQLRHTQDKTRDRAEQLAMHARTPTDAKTLTALTTLESLPTAERNARFRAAFRQRTDEIESLQKQKLTSPFVPVIRTYPTQSASDTSREQALNAARVLVGHDIVWSHHTSEKVTYAKIRNSMKNSAVRATEGPKMKAMRIVLPKGMTLDIDNRRLEFVESSTGLMAKLGMSVDNSNPSTGVILRGEGGILGRVADELVGRYEGIKVFQLGDVATFDYDARQLWPALPIGGKGRRDAKGENGEAGGVTGSIWLHKESTPAMTDRPYEEVPIPEEWTMESFDRYITTLMTQQLEPHLAMRFYGRRVDSDGIRINLLMKAFQNESARPFITPTILNEAISFMMHRGGHRATAEKLFVFAETWGIPMDTTTYNILLGGYVTSRSIQHFHAVLERMAAKYHAPNARTWLHLLKLVEKDVERREVIVHMYDHDAFEDPAARREIAKTMAGSDLYKALKGGKPLGRFLNDQDGRYGEDWFTTQALVNLLEEFFLFYRVEGGGDNAVGAVKPPRYEDLKLLLFSRTPEDGVTDGYEKVIELVLREACRRHDWDFALWGLGLLDTLGGNGAATTMGASSPGSISAGLSGKNPGKGIYEALLKLAISTKSPHALASIVVHGIMAHKFQGVTRELARRALCGSLTAKDIESCTFSTTKKPTTDNGEEQSSNTLLDFWKSTRPPILDATMASWLDEKRANRKVKLRQGSWPFAAIEDVIRRRLGKAAPQEKLVEVVKRARLNGDVSYQKGQKDVGTELKVGRDVVLRLPIHEPKSSEQRTRRRDDRNIEDVEEAEAVQKDGSIEMKEDQ